MTNFRETKEAIVFANEHLVSSTLSDTIELTATCIKQQSIHDSSQVNVLDYMLSCSLATMYQERTRVFYLFGDFGSGKSTVCKSLVNILAETYETSLFTDTTAKPILPIYFDLKLLTGIYRSFEFANKRLEELIEVLFCRPTIPKVAGEDIIKLIRQYPCLIVFDGFDEAVQKLEKSQQNGFLNKLLSILPVTQYDRDLNRIMGNTVTESTIPDTDSRIIISCRNQLFESRHEQETFCEAFYTTPMNINGIPNYQALNINGIDSDTARNELLKHLQKNCSSHILNQALCLDDDQNEIQIFLDYLVSLAINPLMLSLAKSLLLEIEPSLTKLGFINAAQLFTDLISRVMQRDSSKQVINIKEKQQLLGLLALTNWQQNTNHISLENLRNFFFNEYKNYRQLQIGIDTGRLEIETALQDLHSSMIKRNESDMYSFYHKLVAHYFLAIGIYDNVMQEKFDIITQHIFNDGVDKINEDCLIFISQILTTLMVRRDMTSYNKFYRNWMTLCRNVATDYDSKDKAHEMWEIVTGEPLCLDS